MGLENREMFLKHQGFDKIFKKRDFPESSELIKANKGGFTWGYHDHELLKQQSHQDTYQDQPLFDVLLTMSMLQPFDILASKIKNVENRLKHLDLNAKQRVILHNIY